MSHVKDKGHIRMLVIHRNRYLRHVSLSCSFSDDIKAALTCYHEKIAKLEDEKYDIEMETMHKDYEVCNKKPKKNNKDFNYFCFI